MNYYQKINDQNQCALHLINGVIKKICIKSCVIDPCKNLVPMKALLSPTQGITNRQNNKE